MPLSALQIKAAKPKAKDYKLADAHGLYLLITAKGSKLWKQKYRFDGKEKKLSHGAWPAVSLHDARGKRDEAMQKLREGIDPGRKETKRNVDGFRVVAEEWLARKKVGWSDSTYKKTDDRLNKYIYPVIGADAIDEITAADLLDMLRPIEEDGHNELTHRLLQYCSQIFRYAIATRRIRSNPAADLSGALAPVVTTHNPHLKAKELPEFMHRITHEFGGGLMVQMATESLLRLFTRSLELRFMRWNEIDGDLWRIPPDRMKKRRPHLVPLPKQQLQILDVMHEVTGGLEFVFASLETPDTPISENAILYALYRLGYKGRTTGHGFRHTASTILHENGFHTDHIETQLAHRISGVRGTYNHAIYLDERRTMMQWWSDYLDQCLAAHSSKQ